MLKKLMLATLFLGFVPAIFAQNSNIAIKDETAKIEEVKSLVANQNEKKEDFCKIGQDSDTEYVMQFLANSKTLWKGDANWENTLSKEYYIHTNYVKTHLMQYSGIPARVLSIYNNLDETNVVASFKITLDLDYTNCVIITSFIKATVVNKEAKSIFTDSLSIPLITQEDLYSKLQIKIERSFNKNTKTLYDTFITCAKTRIPYEVFMQKMSEYKK